MGTVLSAYRRLLRNKNFLLFSFAGLFSGMGSIIGTIGRDVLVLEVTETGKSLLGLGIILQLPAIFLGPISGVVSDRMNRKHVLIVGRLLLGGLVLLFCFVQSYVAIVVLVIIFVSVTTFTNPASQAILPELVDRQDLIHSNSMISIVATLVAMSGATVASVIISVAGIRTTFVVDSLTFIIGVIIMAKVYYSPSDRQNDKVDSSPSSIKEKRFSFIWTSLKDGLIYLRSNNLVFAVVILSICILFCASIINSLLVALVTEELNGSYADYAELLVWGPFGFLLGSLIISPARKYVSEISLFCIGALVAGICLTTFSFQTEITYAKFLFVPLYVGNALLFISKDTLIQQYTDNAVRGRVSAFTSISGAATTVVVLSLATALYDIVGLRNIFVFASVGVGVLGVIGWPVLILVERQRKNEQTFPV